jgi:hypothetical protein
MMAMSPANLLGSGAARVASVPLISSTPIRISGESKLKVADATAPIRKS